MTGNVAQMKTLVVVGGKPTMNYVVACITLFNSGFQTVRVRARGSHISEAVDVVEMLRRVFLKDLDIGQISLGTEEHKDPRGKQTSVSTIEIFLSKK
jgi:DNA-binding protein